MTCHYKNVLAICLFLLSSASTKADASGEFHKTLSNLPSCPLDDHFPAQHLDTVCNRAHTNSHEVRLLRKSPPHLRKVTGVEAVARLPEQKTWVCPDDDGPMYEEEDSSSSNLVGHMTTWIVENKSSGPVVVSWVDRNRGGLEVSAKNGRISPAHADPQSIIQPGDWTSFNTFQGHLFNVRELREVGGTLVPGRILIRHRPGLVPVGDRISGDNNMHCPVSALVDPDPSELENDDNRHRRTLENPSEFCNVLHRGFLNKVGCPVDIFFAGSRSIEGKTSQCMEKQSNYTSSYSTMEPSLACAETFKMHLGVNPAPQNYIDSWDSPIKFEGSYLTHRFVARMHHDPSIVVDEIVMEPDTVRDCPERSSVVAPAASKERVAQTVEISVDEKPSRMSLVVPMHDGYYDNSTDVYLQVAGASNITAMDAIEAEKVSDPIRIKMGAFAMAQS